MRLLRHQRAASASSGDYLIALTVLLAAPLPSLGQLTNVLVTGKYDILAEAAYAAGLRKDVGLSVDEVCKLEGPEFIGGTPGNDEGSAELNAFQCLQSAKDIQLELVGDDLSYTLEDSGAYQKYNGPIPMEVPDGVGIWVYVKSGKGDDKAYTQISLYRSGSDLNGISSLKVSYDKPAEHELLMEPEISPSFHEHTYKYKVELRQELDFAIEVVAVPGGSVGIEWIDWEGQLGAGWLESNGGEFSSCRLLDDPVCKRKGMTCDHPATTQENRVITFPLKGFKTARKAKINVCGVGNDLYGSVQNYTLELEVQQNFYSHLLHEITYTYAGKLESGAKIDMYPLHEQDRKGYTGKFDPLVYEWEIMLPIVEDPSKRVAVARISEHPLVLKGTAQENGAESNVKAKIVICAADDNKCKNGVDGDGQAETSVYMTDNEARHVDGDAPEWEKTYIFTVTSPDGHNTGHYRVRVKQNVSHAAALSDLVFKDTPCDKDLESDTDFDPDKLFYRCEWGFDAYPDDRTVQFTPSIDWKTCPGCEIQMIDPRKLRREDTLFMDYSSTSVAQNDWWWQKKWGIDEDGVGATWDQTLLLGEGHIVPVIVVAADHSTRKVYHVEVKYSCPPLLSAIFTRYVSSFVSIMAGVMAVGSAGNIMALSKQVQFMILSTVVADAPDTYKQFAKSKTLRVFTGDLEVLMDLPPLCFLPSQEAVENWFEHTFVHVAGLPGDVVGQITKFCAVREKFLALGDSKDNVQKAQDATNAMLCYNFIDWDLLTEHVPDVNLEDSTALERKYHSLLDLNEDSPVNQLLGKCAKRKEEKDDEDEAEEFGESPSRRLAANKSSWKRWRKTGIHKYMVDKVAARRLQDDDLVDFVDDDDEDSLYMWDTDTFDEYIDDAQDSNLDLSLFPDVSPLCKRPEINGVMWSIHLYQALGDVIDTLTGPAGTLLGVMLFLLIGGLIYGTFYWVFMKSDQYRLTALEPGNLVLFVANVLFIPFSMAAGRLAFTDEEIEFFSYTLDPDDAEFVIVPIFCWVGLIAFPVAFVLGFTIYLVKLVNSGKLQYKNDFGTLCWCDPTCLAAKVPWIHWLRRTFPVVPGILNRYVRMCIPILTKEGEPLRVKEQHKDGEDAATDASSNNLVNNDVLEEAAESQAASVDSDADVDNDAENTSKQKAEKQRLKDEAKQKEREEAEAKLKTLMDELAAIPENARAEAAKPGANLAAPWMPDEDKHVCNIGLFNLVKSWELKGHGDDYKLDPEESFAMKQFLDVLVKMESRLLAYNIMTIEPDKGYLKPKEPCTEKDKWWLDDEEDYKTDKNEDTFGHHPGLHEFGFGYGREKTNAPAAPRTRSYLNYVENTLGERLVYDEEGKSQKNKNPYDRSGKIYWMKEPDEGWTKWEEDNKNKKVDASNDGDGSLRYADKWQWITFEHWTQPWNIDEVSELEWELTFCGFHITDYNPAEIVGKKFFMKVRKAVLQYNKNHIPYRITPKDKVEIRKWIYAKLMHCMDMKMKAIYFADQHPMFTQKKELAAMAKQDFHDSLQKLYKPDADGAGAPATTKGDFKLIEYVCMKIEDTYDDDEEPWWGHCDQLEECEIKVQFDQATFWKDSEDKELQELHKANDLVPEGGYFTSPYLDTVKNATVGKKRYSLTKPDGSDTQVQIEVELEHVPSLMTYVSKFKVSMPFESLDLPARQNCEILINEMGGSEKYNFGVEGLTLISAIVVLSAQQVIDANFEGGETFTGGSLVCALAFLIAKGVAFVFGMIQAIAEETEEGGDEEAEARTMVSVKSLAQIEDEREEEEEKKEAEAYAASVAVSRKSSKKRTSKGAANTGSGWWCSKQEPQEEGEGEVGEQKQKIEEDSDSFFNQALEAVQKPENFTLALQTCLLIVIVVALFNERREIAGLFCIIIATVSMICVGLFATLPALKQTLEEQAPAIEMWWDWIRSKLSQRKLQEKAKAAPSAGALVKKFTMTVSDLGLTFAGDVTIDPEASLEDQANSQLKKKLVYWTVHDQDDEDGSSTIPVSVRNPNSGNAQRFEDVNESISVAFSVDQMMLSQAIPPIVACVQCVNHIGNPNISSPKYDNFLTLFKPPGWQPEFDSDSKKIDEMHVHFKEQVDRWFDNTLGAVEADRTYTREIKDQLLQSIRHDDAGGIRKLVKLRLCNLSLPATTYLGDGLETALLYVSVLSEEEPLVPKNVLDFPLDRQSGYFRATKVTAQDSIPSLYDAGESTWTHIKYVCRTPAEDIYEDGELKKDMQYPKERQWDVEEAEVLLPIPGDVGQFRLCIWAQPKNATKSHQLVGFTSLTDVTYLLHKGNNGEKLQESTIHCSWTVKGNSLTPEGGEIANEGGSHTHSLPSRGFMQFAVLQPSDVQAKEDQEAILNLQELISGSGDAVLTTEKVKRFQDCWPFMSRTLGVRLTNKQLEGLETRLKHLKGLQSRMWDEFGNPRDGFETPEKRADAFFAEGVRRGLSAERGKGEKLKEAIARLQLGIEEEKARIQAEKTRLGFVESGTDLSPRAQQSARSATSSTALLQVEEPVASYELLPRVVHGATSYTLQKSDDRDFDPFADELVDQVRKMQKQQRDAGAQIVHYVLLSEHIKPGKNWRPDAISPHLAKIVAHEIEDIPLVILKGFVSDPPRDELIFEHEYNDKDKPILVNGRLCFKCFPSIFSRIGSRQVSCYLYWSGKGCWIISETKGAQLPKVIRKTEERHFLWVQDNAPTPDQVTNYWYRAARDTSRHHGGKKAWERDQKICIEKPSAGSRRRGRLGLTRNLNMNAGPTASSSLTPRISESLATSPRARPQDTSGRLTTLFTEITKLFKKPAARKVDPELKECLIALTSKNLSVCWKDFRMEALAPFRKWLLDREGSYKNVWVFLTDTKVISKDSCSTNLATMFEKTRFVIKEHDAARQEAMEKDEDAPPNLMSKKSKDVLLSFVESVKDGLDAHADKIVYALDGGGDGSLSQAEMDQIWETDGTETKLRQKARAGDTALRVTDAARFKVGQIFKVHMGSGYQEVREITKIDNETSEFHFEEPLEYSFAAEAKVGALKLLPGELSKFQQWVFKHPIYRHPENFWADLTDGEGIDWPEFKKATLGPNRGDFMKSYLSSTKMEKLKPDEVKEEAKKLFQLLDAQGGGSVSLNELMPSTGPEFADIDRTLLKFSIPLAHISEVRINTTSQPGGKGPTQRLRINVKPEFEDIDEQCEEFEGIEHRRGWKAFRTALDPDWQPVHNREYVEIMMSDAFFELWKTVIDDSGISRPQEWVRYYDGDTEDHATLKGKYMRNNEGTQRWSNGHFYKGLWKNHVYEGKGDLWAKYEDYSQNLTAMPIYTGYWQRGKRHGQGTLRFMQELRDSSAKDTKSPFKQKGFSKIYEGQFKNDLFHGMGRLRLEKASASGGGDGDHPSGKVARTPTHKLGVYPAFTTDPAKITDFDGEFASDWATTYVWVKGLDPHWNDENEEDEMIVDATSTQSMTVSMTASAAAPLKTKFDWETKDDEDDEERKEAKLRKAEQSMDLELEKLDRKARMQKSNRYLSYFADSEDKGAQKSGPPLPDLALKAYGYKGGDTMHLKNGKAKYVDGTTYIGDFVLGLPQGAGKLTKDTIVYHGEWTKGFWTGKGTLQHQDGYTYQGDWSYDANSNSKLGFRNGFGLLENTDPFLQNKFGYHAYRGNWKNDQREGDGEMVFSIGDDNSALIMFEGSFYAGKRHGQCKMYYLVEEEKVAKGAGKTPFRTSLYMEGTQKSLKVSKEYFKPKGSDAYLKDRELNIAEPPSGNAKSFVKLLYFAGEFHADNMVKDKKMWLHLVNPDEGTLTGQYYYGFLAEDGTRSGEGQLYSAEAGNDPDFMEKVLKGEPYEKEDLAWKGGKLTGTGGEEDAKMKLKFLLYSGQWRRNLPHGTGMQFYPEVGTKDKHGVHSGGLYYGEFKDGQRHGRGTWEVRDKSFKYSPLPHKKAVWNWKNDMMEGVAVVEDNKYVHENVIYQENKTAMPFTTIGPPTTKFDSTTIGAKAAGLFKQKKKSVLAQPHRSMTSALEKKTSARASSFTSSFGIGTSQGGVWSHDDTSVMQKVARHGGKLKADAFRTDDAGQELEADALLREPTEIMDTEEDLLVSGGTGENAAMNGLYFKLTKSFGHTVWRMVKADASMFGDYHQRYLYKDDRNPIWYLGPKPLDGQQRGAGCAMVEDEMADGPSSVRTPWLVWSEAQSDLLNPLDDKDENDQSTVDVIDVQGIVGFAIESEDLSRGDPHDLNHRLLSRCSAEFYQRPVYANESYQEDSGLFMYWFKQGGNKEEGRTAGDESSIRDATDPSSLFVAGYWVVSKELGAGPPGPGMEKTILAYVEDKAVSPFGIEEGAKWYMADDTATVSSWVRWNSGYSRIPSFKLEPQALDRKNVMMDYFDSDGEEESPRADPGGMA